MLNFSRKQINVYVLGLKFYEEESVEKQMLLSPESPSAFVPCLQRLTYLFWHVPSFSCIILNLKRHTLPAIVPSALCHFMHFPQT